MLFEALFIVIGLRVHTECFLTQACTSDPYSLEVAGFEPDKVHMRRHVVLLCMCTHVSHNVRLTASHLLQTLWYLTTAK